MQVLRPRKGARRSVFRVAEGVERKQNKGEEESPLAGYLLPSQEDPRCYGFLLWQANRLVTDWSERK